VAPLLRHFLKFFFIAMMDPNLVAAIGGRRAKSLAIFSVSDPYSFDSDPIQIHGFDDQKLEKFTAEKN
jgi:hypothetical protein